MKNRIMIALVATLLPVVALAQFVDNDQVNNEYARDDAALVFWASEVIDMNRGWVDYQNESLGYASFGGDTDMLGPDGTPVSLGDAGSVTLGFDQTIVNGEGDDFVVFENGFGSAGSVFMEIAFVEVSSNGTDFSRLPAFCRHEGQIGGFDMADPADFYNLAGNFQGGTGIDLQDLVDCGDANVASGAVALNNIQFVRLVDVVGDVDGPGTTFDYLGRPVSDPYPTPYASSGMDITGVAGINAGPVAVQPSSWDNVKSLYR